MNEILYNLYNGNMLYFVDFVSLYICFFLVFMLHKAGGRSLSELSFSHLFQKLSWKTFLIYFVFVIANLSIIVWLLNSDNTNPYNPLEQLLANEVFRLPEIIIDDWYVVFFKYFLIALLKILPAIVIGYYLVALHKGGWKMTYFTMYWKQVLAVVILVISLNSIHLFATQTISQVFIRTLAQTMENPEVLVFLSVLIALTISVFYYAVMGCSTYFAIAPANEKRSAVKEELNKELLDK